MLKTIDVHVVLEKKYRATKGISPIWIVQTANMMVEVKDEIMFQIKE